MKESYKVVDDFCPHIDLVIASAKQSGFGTWLPNRGKVGSSVYDGMNFWGKHGYMVASLAVAMNTHIAPHSMFFRKTVEESEKAYIHSDRECGAYTCVAYLSNHDEKFGTAFYKHKIYGQTMPALVEVDEALSADMVGRTNFIETDFVGGKFNRAVIFKAPLFHSRIPETGFADGRLVWVCHFDTPETLGV